MALDLLYKTPGLKRFLLAYGRKRAVLKLERLCLVIDDEDSVLDIGSGNGVLSSALKSEGIQVTSLDVANHSFVEEIEPVIYDGKRIPFENKSFDTALLITVLHHTPKPEDLIMEATRVAERVIIIEETYRSTLGKYWVFLIDSLFNFEFFGHPHTNKTDDQWKNIFVELGLRLSSVETYRDFPALSRVLYVLQQKSPRSD